MEDVRLTLRLVEHERLFIKEMTYKRGFSSTKDYILDLVKKDAEIKTKWVKAFKRESE